MMRCAAIEETRVWAWLTDVDDEDDDDDDDDADDDTAARKEE